jgi:hypothetical protein
MSWLGFAWYCLVDAATTFFLEGGGGGHNMLTSKLFWCISNYSTLCNQRSPTTSNYKLIMYDLTTFKSTQPSFNSGNVPCFELYGTRNNQFWINDINDCNRMCMNTWLKARQVRWEGYLKQCRMLAWANNQSHWKERLLDWNTFSEPFHITFPPTSFIPYRWEGKIMGQITFVVMKVVILPSLLKLATGQV